MGPELVVLVGTVLYPVVLVSQPVPCVVMVAG